MFECFKSSSEPILLTELVLGDPTPPQEKAYGHIQRIDKAKRVMAVASLVILGLTAVLIALACAGKFHALGGVYVFSGFPALWIAIKILDVVEKGIGEKHKIDVEQYYKLARGSSEEDSSSSESGDDSSD